MKIDKKEVLRLVYEGMSRSQIAKTLGCTLAGVKAAIGRMRENGIEFPNDYDELKAYAAQLASQKKRNSIENERAK